MITFLRARSTSRWAIKARARQTKDLEKIFRHKVFKVLLAREEG
jgi:hypothetical protein